jgi:large subunit ribosomal protein L5e
MCEANSKELVKFGLTACKTNYAAAYATGLLLSRRLLKQVALDTTYKGAATSGEYFSVVDDV